MDASLLFFDLETTGPDPVNDRVCQVGFLDSQRLGMPIEQLVNPGRPIPADATAVHGITDEMVRHSPTFAQLAPELFKLVQGRNLAGFELLNFDVPMLWEEFHRCGYTWDLQGISVIDAGLIYKFKESRRLDDAVARYAPQCANLPNHQAGSDCVRTHAVFQGQMKEYGDLARMSVQELAKFCEGDRERIDAKGTLTRDKNGEIVYAIGRMKGLVVKANPGAAEWMLGKDFPAQTKYILREILAGRIS